MKTIFFSIAVIATFLSACSSNDSTPKEEPKASEPVVNNVPVVDTTRKQAPSVDETVTAYLQVKNALTNDDGVEAAEAGKRLQTAFRKMATSSFADDQKKLYDDVKEDINEHAGHISSNAKKIAHQREHFDMLIKDMYDLVKMVKPGQALYKDHCPMFNDNKGAIWLSEVKEIKNPYYGKKMLTCGKQQEEIK